MAITSCALLKLSLSKSNALDGAACVKNKSKSNPYENTSDVDGSSAGYVMTGRVFAIDVE